jgi:CO/xanthine dehydrogenase FAD-binding subunit
MITAYHRPATLDEAFSLLAQPGAVPLGGGTMINTPQFEKSPALSVVDLQALGLDQVTVAGQDLDLGACVTLEQLRQSEQVHPALRRALAQEAPLNLRNMATVAGTLIVADGRSPFATVMLALDARLTLQTRAATEVRGLGEVLPLRAELLRGKLITKVTVPLRVELAFEMVSRTPADKPIVSAALARWPGGRLRLALGGFGTGPILALDATDASGLEPAARNAFHGATDPWASAEYRIDVAATLARRCLDGLSGGPSR